jgi:hypothetical protein
LAHTCNPSYSGGRDQEDCDLRLAQGNSSLDTTLKIPTQKKADRVAQVVEPSKHEALNSNPNTTKKKSFKYFYMY